MRVVITGGGTGGHVFPGLVVARALKSQDVIYAGSAKGFEKRGAEALGIPFYPIRASQITGKGALKKILNSANLASGFIQSLFFLRKFKPQVVIGTGGYVSAPVLLAASALKTKTLLLEQNLLPGRTTRFFSTRVSRVLTSFDESEKYLPGASVRVTGNPVREEIGKWGKREACEKLGLSPDRPVIFVTGASQGAQAINRCVLGALPMMADESWQIVHQTGEKHYEAVVEESKKNTFPGKLFYKAVPFVDEMGVMYGACDVVVARGGATSMAEILAAGKPSLIVPYPYAADDHQELNAKWLEDKGGCRVVSEKNFTPAFFCSTLKEWLGSPETLRGMGERARAAAHPDALERILDAIQEVAGDRLN